MSQAGPHDSPWTLQGGTPEERRIWEMFLSRGLSRQNDRRTISVTCIHERSRYIEETPDGTTGEGFILRFGEPVTVTYTSLRGLYYGLVTLADLRNRGDLPEGELHDYPRFPFRGIIEGFYGTPWSHEARKEMIRFLPEIRMNSFFYGPKDDPFHRELWRDAYPQGELCRLEELLKTSGDQDTLFWYSLSPGLSIRYSSREDRRLLAEKFLQLYGIGVRHFGLFLDDIPETLLHREDREAFSDLVEAHIFLINDIFESLTRTDPRIALAVCPTKYWGKPGYYLTRMGEGIDGRIHLFHTGPEICSRELALRDAVHLERVMGRPVLYWDNYPVNDAEMTHELHIGPYEQRDRHLYRAAEGVIANGMEYPEASKIPFFTIGEYLWNPEHYNPEESLKRAVHRVLGERDWEAFLPFVDNNRSSCLASGEPTALQTALGICGFHLQRGEIAEALTILKEEYTRLAGADALFKGGMENATLEKDIRPWAEKYSLGVEILGCVIELLDGGEEDKPVLMQRFEELAERFFSTRAYVFSDVLPLALTEIRKFLTGEV
ncbi:MAG: beta-N-acetylglucosaminidase domain-containing protein [Spirochaetales bacterium]|nr:beta-N-acetylglucosaminidase domain-containing protein [Spirochaetales bacterium]